MPKPMIRGHNSHQNQPKNSLGDFFKREKEELGLNKTKAQKRAERTEKNKADIEMLKKDLAKNKPDQDDPANENNTTNQPPGS